jgi:hypothetical protein
MLDGKKTYIAAIGAVLIALGYFLTNWVDNGVIEPQALVSALIALALLFLRKGIKTTGVK